MSGKYICYYIPSNKYQGYYYLHKNYLCFDLKSEAKTVNIDGELPGLMKEDLESLVFVGQVFQKSSKSNCADTLSICCLNLDD